MAAARDQQPGLLCRENRRAQVDPGDRAARPLADPVIPDRDDDRRTSKLFLEAPCDDPDHAGVPAVRRDHRDRTLGLDRLGRLLNLGFDRAAFLVEAVELLGDPARLVGVLGRQQPHAEIGFADPSASIDSRSQREAEIGRGRCAGKAACLDQRVHADVAALSHHLEALCHEGAVQPPERGDVRHGAQCDDVEQVEQLGLRPGGEETASAQHADQGGAEQPRNPDCGKVAMIATLFLVEPVGVHQRQGDGQLRRAFVVIDHDHFGARLAGFGQRVEGHRAAIDRDDQVGALALQPHQRFARRAIAFHQPVWDVGARVEAQVAQQPDQQGRRCRAVDVIVAKDRHRLAPLDGLRKPFGRRVHVAEDRGVGHEGTDAGVAVRLQFLARAAARQQQLGHQIVGCEAGVARIRFQPAPAPGLAEDRAVDVEHGSHRKALARIVAKGNRALNPPGSCCVPWCRACADRRPGTRRSSRLHTSRSRAPTRHS
eukprot:Opistho-1_new@69082